MSDDYEYDPEYIEAYKQTFEYQTQRLGYAIQDVGTAISEAVLKGMLPLQAFLSEWHVEQVLSMNWLRRYWHFLTGHRR